MRVLQAYPFSVVLGKCDSLLYYKGMVVHTLKRVYTKWTNFPETVPRSAVCKTQACQPDLQKSYATQICYACIAVKPHAPISEASSTTNAEYTRGRLSTPTRHDGGPSR